MKPETIDVTVRKTLVLADADGEAIAEGSVLQHVNDDHRGVVVRVVRPGSCAQDPLEAAGDIQIQIGYGSRRCTNIYSDWRHVPHDNQTHEERLASRLHREFYHDEYCHNSKGEQYAIDVIKALLPARKADELNEYGPDDLDTALECLAQYMDELKTKL